MAKGAFGAQVELVQPSAAAAGTPSTSITGLSSRQPLFGSSVGGVAQDAIWQYDSTLGRIGLGSSAPEARFYAVPPAGGANVFGWATTAGVHVGGVNSSGHLGLGTTAPTAQLHLTDSAANLRFSCTVIGSSFAGIWGGTAAPSAANSALFTDGALTVLNTPVGDGNVVALRVGNISVIRIASTGGGTTQTLGFFQAAGTTRAPGYATTGTTSRTMNSTITPAAVYTSDVGAQLNALQGVLKTLIQDLSANVGYGILASTV